VHSTEKGGRKMTAKQVKVVVSQLSHNLPDVNPRRKIVDLSGDQCSTPKSGGGGRNAYSCFAGSTKRNFEKLKQMKNTFWENLKIRVKKGELADHRPRKSPRSKKRGSEEYAVERRKGKARVLTNAKKRIDHVSA